MLARIVWLFAGVVCFLLEEDWTATLSKRTKVPLYALLGFSLSFSMVTVLSFFSRDLANQVDLLVQVFTMADVAKFAARLASKYKNNTLLALFPTKPLIHSVVQVRLLAISSIMSGLYFG